MRIVQDDSPDRDEQAALWCLDLANDAASADDLRAFEEWRADPANEEAYQRAVDAWETLELVGGAPEIVLMRSEALDDYRRHTLSRGRRRPRWKAIGWGAGGALAASIALAFGWSSLPVREDFRTGIGERRVALLDDGSRLSLDADSEVETSFDKRHRALTLTRGRARFDVAHNPLRPFTVAVGDKLVVATGTSFSVERLGADAHVVLYQGHVAVLNGAGAPVALEGSGRAADEMLVPGTELTVSAASAGPAVLLKTDTTDAAWQRGQISFDDTPLPIAVERMNRYLRKPMVIGDGKVAATRVTGVFDSADDTGFLAAIRQFGGVRAERLADRVMLIGP